MGIVPSFSSGCYKYHRSLLRVHRIILSQWGSGIGVCWKVSKSKWILGWPSGATLMILLKTKVFDHQTSDFGDDLNI